MKWNSLIALTSLTFSSFLPDKNVTNDKNERQLMVIKRLCRKSWKKKKRIPLKFNKNTLIRYVIYVEVNIRANNSNIHDKFPVSQKSQYHSSSKVFSILWSNTSTCTVYVLGWGKVIFENLIFPFFFAFGVRPHMVPALMRQKKRSAPFSIQISTTTKRNLSLYKTLLHLRTSSPIRHPLSWKISYCIALLCSSA